ncbi:MAG TPA: hypothetical protein VIM70_15185 [Clostridium sp.]|uniref:hypothetical protein n=1 Tax=Clostridium sp. TaxID=1506 RepID=UPI002F942729
MKFYNQIKSATIEKEVEIVYKNALDKAFPNSILTHPYGCDGYIEQDIIYDEITKTLRIIMEFKCNKDFNDRLEQAKVIVQVLFYLKRFRLGLDKNYSIVPNIVLAGDKNACFLIHTKEIEKYLQENIDWSTAPSKGPQIHLNLVYKISKDTNLNVFIFKIGSTFNFRDIAVQIKRLVLNYNRKMRINIANLPVVYDYFIAKIVEEPEKYSATELVYFFINVITDNPDTFIQPKKKNLLYVGNVKDIKVDNICYKYFEANYSTKYSPNEKQTFIEIADRLIEDTTRRYKGDFYTPTIWVNEANKRLTETFGENWRNEYVVWDCAWGTGNLTRDYTFKELYCSTLRKTDLDLGEKNNSDSYKFVYDFLVDDIEMLNSDLRMFEKNYKTEINNYKKLLVSLKKNKKIIFFINPPFAEAGNDKCKDRKIKTGTSKTLIGEAMNKDCIGGSSQQLYAQFLYRILKIKEMFKLTDINIAVFSPTLLLTGPKFEGFREKFLKEFTYEKGIMFNASNFSNVSNQWEIAFTIWKCGETKNKENFDCTVEEISNEGNICEIGVKNVYNVSKNKRASNWIKVINKYDDIDTIALKSSVNVDNKIVKTRKEALGYLINDSNNVYANAKGVYILSSKVTRHLKTTEINEENYEKCFSLFAARCLIKANWKNQKEEYMIPDTGNSLYKGWINDCIIYSIFENSSYQGSLRNIIVSEQSYNVINQSFFMGNEEIRELADKNYNDEIFQDTKLFQGERFIYMDLKNRFLSNEGRKVLEKAKELVVKSFEYRGEFNILNPKYQINTWDAGWYQIKALIKKYMKSDLKEFEELFKKLSTKMEPQVYELGFLKNNKYI